MTILTRQDGTAFVVQAYRERLKLGKRSALVQQLRELSEQHGQYLALFAAPNGTLEVVLSKESGYLLGETVWNHFDRPANFIFCERISKEHNQVLLIVVRAGQVHMDTQVDNDKLRAELLPLMALNETFRVIISGEVSLSQADLKSMAASFEVVKEPVFKTVPLLPACRLLSLPLVMKSALLGPRFSIMTIALSTVAVLAIVWAIYTLVPTHPAAVVVPKMAAQQPDVAYMNFYAAMRTPAPALQLDELAQAVEKFYALPGWQAGTVRFDGNQYRLHLIRQGGSVQWLTQWAAQHQYALNINGNGAEISMPSQLPGRPTPKALYSLPQVMASLIDQLDRLFQNQVVSVGEVQTFGSTKSRTVTINLKDVSPDVLTLVGNTLGDDLPLSVSAINVSVNAGLLNGSIQLSAWGI